MKFVILSSGRSGNNMLRSALIRHPRIACHDEVLSNEFNFAHLGKYWSLTSDELAVCRRQLAASPADFLCKYVFASPDPNRDRFGFRLFYEHHAPGSKADAWDWINSQPDIRLIHLQRRNRLRQLLSERTALLTLEWTRTRPNAVPPPQIALSARELAAFAKRTEANRDAALARLGKLPCLDIAYEDIIADLDAQVRRIQGFLEVEEKDIKPHTLRQGGQRLEDRISNFEALRAELQDTPFAWMFDDDEDARPEKRLFAPKASSGRSARRCIRVIAQASTLDLDILPHWVRHYRSLGITEFHLVLHGKGLELFRMRRACRRLGLTIESEIGGKFSDEEKRLRQQAIVDRFTGEWLLLSDMDEFLELPYRDLATTIRALEGFGVSALPAVLVQRVAADGRLPKVTGSTDLDQAFPLASTLLGELMGSHTISRSKFPLFLASEATRVQLGQHQQPNSDAANYIPICAVLHHYKWRSRLLADLPSRSKNAHISYLESRAYLKWLADHQNQLPLDGAFVNSRPALSERGLLRRANRTEIAFGGLLRRLRGSRASTAGRDGRMRLNRRLRRAAREMDAYPADRAPPAAASAGSAARIAIVTFELLIPDRSGGIGTWAANLAMSLRAAGHTVTIFYAKRWHGDSAWPARYWKANNVELVHLALDERQPFAEDTLYNLAHVALEALAPRSWDIIHVPDAVALGWQIAGAKRAGIAFRDATIVVTLHGNSWWHRTNNRLSIAPLDAELNHLEMEQVRGADVIVAPSAYMLDYMERTYPGLIKEGFVHQNPISWPLARKHAATGRRAVKEFVFFGRLEARKGLWTFCDAVAELIEDGVTGFSVTFLGAYGSAEIRPELLQRIKNWPSARIIEHFQVDECRLYLSEPGRLAIMPSNGDNSPYTILECIAAGIPFLATRVGGVAELIRSEDQDHVLLGQDADDLAAALRRCLVDGAVVARAAIPPRISELRLLLWHEHLLAARRRSASASTPRRLSLPSISVCIGPRPSPGPDVTMDWVRSPGVDTEILVAQGQLPPKVATLIEESRHAEQYSTLAYQEVERTCSSIQAHFNLCAARARNEILVFADASIRPDPGSIQMLARMLMATDSAALATHVRLELQRVGKPIRTLPDFRVMSAGTPSLARLKNVFGGPIFAVRREVFTRLGGFDERPQFSRAWHWEWLARLLEAGERVEILPFCFGSWRTEISSIDRDWPWGSVQMFDHMDDLRDDGRLTIARRHLQMLQDYLRNTMPTFERVRRALGHTVAAPKGDQKRQSLLHLQGADLATLRPFKNTRMAATSSGIEIRSNDEDPKVRLPTIVPVGKARDLVVEISVNVPNEGNLKVYWCNGKDTFTEDRSVARYLLPGQNNISVRVSNPTFPVSLRLDPGESPGKYLLHSIAVFGE